jgi:hypothetical protein
MRIEEIRRALAARLRARRPEIEQAALTRIYSLSDPGEDPDPEYLDGLRRAVAAALDYGIEAVERSEDRPAPMPPVLLIQARLAARHGVKLETVLRRYLAGYTLLGDFLIEESETGGNLKGPSLKRLLRAQAGLLDRLVTAVSEEYAREENTHLGSVEQSRVERVERLLAGEFVDTSELAYELRGHHLGVVVAGEGAPEALTGLAKALDRRLLLIRPEEGTVWAWLGSGRDFDPEEIESLASREWPATVSLALGEPGEGLAGWRLTHRQARAALPIALHGPRLVVRYADVALVASMLRDDLLTTSLRELYLDPLSDQRDGGTALRETLRAYFAHDRNISSAAATLQVSRHTVKRRLHEIEQLLSSPLGARAVELEAALRMQDLSDSLSHKASFPGS